MDDKIELVLLGDICPTADNLNLFLENRTAELLGNLRPVLKEADLVFANLEFVITDQPRPVVKSGPILHAPTKVVETLKSAGVEVFSLANNHIKDCGTEGVRSTMDALSQAGIDYFGAALNLEAAKKPFVKTIKGKKIGFLAFAEQEFNTATEHEAGANFLDPYEDFDEIERLKAEVDYLIVIYHGGIEHYRYPSPLLQKKCRKFIEKGADFVSCQHSHIIGTIETYRSKNIIYGQGNSIFGYRKNNDAWNQGLLVKIELDRQTGGETLKLVPISASPEGGISLMERPEAEKILADMEERSKNLNNREFIADAWSQFSKQKSALYCSYFLGHNKWLIRFNKMTGNKLVRMLYPKKQLAIAHNIIRCEAHNEVIQTVLKSECK